MNVDNWLSGRQTGLMRSLTWLSLLAASSLLACEKKAETPEEVSTETSPESTIYPAPLVDDPSESALRKDANAGEKPANSPLRMIEIPRTRALASEEFQPTQLLGLRTQASFAMANAEREELGVALHPQFQIDFLVEEPGRGARMHFEFMGPVSLFLAGTQLRARQESEKLLLVWPDERSYRAVPLNSLSALFRDRRVDASPRLSTQVRSLPAGERLGRTTEAQLFTNDAVEVRMESLAAPQVGGELLCRILLGIARVEKELCPPDRLPLFAEFKFLDEERTARFSVDALEEVVRLEPEDFFMPPKMAIFKPGELPPMQNQLFEKAPLPLPREGAPLSVENLRARPVYVLFDGIPLALLGPGEKWQIPAGERSFQVEARSALGWDLSSGLTATGGDELEVAEVLRKREELQPK